MASLTGKQFIAGTLSAAGTARFTAHDPAKGIAIEPEFIEATSDEIDQAVIAADACFDEYRKKSAREIAIFLEAIAAELVEAGEELDQRVHAETGLPFPRIQFEKLRAANQAKLFAEVVRDGTWLGARIDLPSQSPGSLTPSDVRQTQMPIGPVAVFGASNFPLAISVLGNDSISALAAGCPVIVKAHPGHPGTCELLAQIMLRAIEKCGMPSGIFSMVQGASHRVGHELVSHSLIAGVGFTGSLAGGRALFNVAMQREVPIPFFAEMGSINPVFLLPSALANPKDLARGFVKAMTAGMGQLCTQPGLLIVDSDSDFHPFLSVVNELIAKTKPETMLHQGIYKSFLSGIELLSAKESVQLVSKSEIENSNSVCSTGPILMTTKSEDFLNQPDLQSELFGPSTLLVQCEKRESMLDIAKALKGSLTATIHGTEKELEENHELVGVLERKAGRLIFNGFPPGVPVCHAMHHGGPYPATIDGKHTSIGTASILRWGRTVCYMDFPQSCLPVELKNSDDATWRMIDGKMKRGKLTP